MELTDKDLTLFTPYRITSADTDMDARLRLSGLSNLLIQSAISSADSLGFGFGGLKQQHLFWVLSRMTIEIYRPLKWYEEAIVETWPKDIEGIIYLRDFIVRDKAGEVVAKATSGWLAIDLKTKRPKRIDGLDGELFMLLKDKHALKESPEKLAAISSGDSFEVKATYFDIDLNKHVTSTRYVDWMMDSLPLDFCRTNYPTRFSINYLKETMPGEVIRFMRSKEDVQSCFHFEGLNLTSNTNAFRGKIEF
ncbi:MAG TPA: acyl-ACP thioesterase domain-containing protein [Williamwhitmania sp.]|nr:acyl-ACP thioesterase domain-containing protein [Williamwhitmania sp.]